MALGIGSTVGLNALLARGGAKTGLLTTRGHEDNLFIGRIHQKVAGLGEEEIKDVVHLDKATPLIPRSLVCGINERMDYKGAMLATSISKKSRAQPHAWCSRGLSRWRFVFFGHS